MIHFRLLKERNIHTQAGIFGPSKMEDRAGTTRIDRSTTLVVLDGFSNDEGLAQSLNIYYRPPPWAQIMGRT